MTEIYFYLQCSHILYQFTSTVARLAQKTMNKYMKNKVAFSPSAGSIIDKFSGTLTGHSGRP